MRARREEKTGWRAKVRPLLIGILGAVVFGAACFLLVAMLMTFADLSSFAVTALAVVAAAIGAFVGGLFAAKSAGEQGWLMGLLCGASLLIPIVVLGAILHHHVQIGFLFIKLFTLLLSGMAGGVVGVNKR